MTITLCNGKGGSGKTTLTVLLASAMAEALANHVQKLVLTPKETPDGQVLAVSGDVDLFGGDDRVMLMVARDGIGRRHGVDNTQVIDSTNGLKG